MTKLTVSNFSSINSAHLELGDLTVIVGPQASGKSLLSKLNYFFVQLLNDQYSLVGEDKDIEHFKEFIREKFLEWFPITAWGENKFTIEYEAGSVQMRFSRNEYKRKLSNNFCITFSSFFEDHYASLLSEFREAIIK